MLQSVPFNKLFYRHRVQIVGGSSKIFDFQDLVYSKILTAVQLCAASVVFILLCIYTYFFQDKT